MNTMTTLIQHLRQQLARVTAPALAARAGRASALFIVFLLAACTAEETPVNPARPITFTSYTAQPVTRADSALLADNAIPAGRSIGVYAYYHDNATWSDAAAPNFMCNQQATNIGLEQPFSYAPLKYWPNENEDKVSFIAYYPYTSNSSADVAALGLTALLANTGTGLPSFQFAVNDNVKQQVDFMVSDLLPNLPNGTAAVTPGAPAGRDDLTVTDRVRFLFRHALAKIEFRVIVDEAARQDLAYYTLKGIQLTNIYNKAQLTPTYTPPVAPATEGTTTFTWTDYDSPAATTYACKTTEAYLLLPQALGDDAQLTVNYDLAFKSEGTTYTYDADGNPVPTEEYAFTSRTTTYQLNTLKLTGTTTPIDKWLPNHHYVYNLVIKPHRIEFTGQVVEWGQEVPFVVSPEAS